MRTCIALICFLVGMAGVAMAQEPNQCRLNVTPVRFGDYNPLARGDARGNGIISYSCSTSMPISIAIEHGNGAVERRMAKGAVPLEYNLYLDAACTVIWGDGSAGSQLYRDPTPRPDTDITVPVYACIRGGQRQAGVGVYNASLTVTIHY